MQSNLAWASMPGEEKVDLREIWRKVWGGRRPILLAIVAGCLLGFLVIQQLTPQYTASSSVMLETRQLRLVDTAEAVLPGLSVSAEVIEGEIAVLYSRDFAQEVVRDLQLYMHPEFNQDLAGANSSFAWSDLRDYWLGWIVAYARDLVDGTADEDRALTDQQVAARLHQRIVDGILDKLRVEQVGQSPVLRISFTSGDPETATRIANAAAEIYIEDQLQRKSEASSRVGDWLAQRIERLRTEVATKEREIEEFRARSGLIAGAGREGGEVMVAKQQISELATDLIDAQVERQGVESRLEQVEGLAAGANGVETAIDVLELPLIQSLRIEEAQLRRELAELSSEFGPRHPRVTTVTAKLSDIETSIRSEINKIVLGLRNQVETARRREAAIQVSVEALEAQVAEVNTQDVELRARQREAEASRTLLESFLARAQETAEQEGMQQPDARIISTAAPPEFPSFPNKKLFMALAFCASAVAGVSIAYVLQALDQSFHTSREVRDQLGLPVLELVPSVRRIRRKLTPFDCVIEHPNSSFTEALRNLQVTLFGGNYPPKTMLVTSSLPGEGKTSLVLAFGRFLALSGRSVMVLDCDLRKPSIHRLLESERGPGLVDHLLGRVTLEEIVRSDERTGMRYIASGPPANNPPDLLTSPALRAMLAEVERSYDVVLIDSAPFLAVADTRCLQPLVELTVFVVRWRDTQRASAREAVRRVRQAGFSLAGVVLNAVDPKEYGHYEEGYYYTAVRTYYQE